MNRPLTFIAGTILGVTVACASGAASDIAQDSGVVHIDPSTDPGEITDNEFDRITVDGMPCVIWKDGRELGGHDAFAYSGLTCDWDDR